MIGQQLVDWYDGYSFNSVNRLWRASYPVWRRHRGEWRRYWFDLQRRPCLCTSIIYIDCTKHGWIWVILGVISIFSLCLHLSYVYIILFFFPIQMYRHFSQFLSIKISYRPSWMIWQTDRQDDLLVIGSSHLGLHFFFVYPGYKQSPAWHVGKLPESPQRYRICSFVCGSKTFLSLTWWTWRNPSDLIITTPSSQLPFSLHFQRLPLIDSQQDARV